MVMIPLVIDQEVQEKIKKVIKHATNNPTSLETMMKLAKGEPAPGGLNADFTIDIPMGFSVTYTHEEHPGSMCKHLSMSVHAKDRVPNPIAVEMILKEFGFTNSLSECLKWGTVWEEKFGENNQTAINIVEPLNGDFVALGAKQ